MPRAARRIAAVLAFMTLHGCQRSEPEAARARQAAPSTAASGAAATVRQVQDAPGRYLGQKVRVTGKIDAVWSDHVFELEGTDWAFGDNIMVITSPAIPLALRAFGRDDELIVTGTVRRFIDSAEELERELNISFLPEIEVRLKARPLLIADSIRKIGDVPAAGVRDPTPAIDRTPTVADVQDAAASYYGKRVRLAGTVDEILSDRAFELEGAAWAFGDDIVVLTKTPVQFAGSRLARDSELIVSGVVRRSVDEHEIGWGPTPELETKVEEHPVLIADSIRLINDDGRDGRWSADRSQ